MAAEGSASAQPVSMPSFSNCTHSNLVLSMQIRRSPLGDIPGRSASFCHVVWRGRKSLLRGSIFSKVHYHDNFQLRSTAADSLRGIISHTSLLRLKSATSLHFSHEHRYHTQSNVVHGTHIRELDHGNFVCFPFLSI